MRKILTLALLTSSLHVNAADTFLGSVKIDFSPIKYSELKTRVKEFAQQPGYLSLGESHLQTPTAIQVNHDLVTSYLDETQKRKTIFCSETLKHFLGPYGQEIEEKVKKYKIFEKNSPYVTDFTQCMDRKVIENYVTYSGFFHQYPFARSFVNEFPRTPVVTRPGNNIKAQMKGLNGLFVTQMELEYMEFSATKAILEMGLTEAKQIREKSAHLETVVNTLVDNMEEVISTDDPYTSKKAVVINAKDFDEELYANESSYFLMTNLSYRQKSDSLKALKALTKRDDQALDHFLNKIKNSKFRVVTVFLGPFPGGELGTVTYPGVARTFKGQSLIMHIKNASEEYLMVMEPDADDFVCVDYQTSEEIACF